MAVYHFSAKTVSRSAGRSSVAAAAYRAGERLVEERTGEIHDYTRKGGVVDSQVILPGGGTMARSELWNSVEAKHKRGDATVAREFVVALPAELDASQRGGLAKAYARELADRYGVAVDVNVHAPGKEGDQRNHHAHILMSACYVSAQGEMGKKAVELDPIHCQRRGLVNVVEVERERWEHLTNQALERAGQEARIDHRSLADQGIEDRAPGIHLGPTATAIVRRGGVSTIEERARDQAREFIAEAQARAVIADAARQHVAELETELAMVKLQALPVAEQRKQVERLVAERESEIHDLVQRRVELQSIYHRAHRREVVEDAHAKAPGLIKEAKTAAAQVKATQLELERTGWWRPFKRARLRDELPAAQERAAQLLKTAKATRDLAASPIRENVAEALKVVEEQIRPGAERCQEAKDHLYRLEAQEAAQKAQEAALRRQADAEAARAVMARVEAQQAARERALNRTPKREQDQGLER